MAKLTHSTDWGMEAVERAAIERGDLDPPNAAAPISASSWRPMTSAPVDESVLLWEEATQGHYVATYGDGIHGAGWYDRKGREVFSPTHWMPIPTPPSVEWP
jgi:hypothetical protein